VKPWAKAKTVQQAGSPVMTVGMRLSVVVLAFVLFGTGCMKVGPDYVRPETAVRPNWLESDGARVTNGPADYRAWWRVFHDPVLDRLVDKAYRQNLSIRVAGVRVLEARAQVGIAVGQLYPQTQQAIGSLQYNWESAHSYFAAAGISAYTQDQIGVTANWEIDFWGKFRRAIESADATLKATVADYDNALVSLTADVATNYISIKTLEKRIEIARQNVETQRESLKIAEARFTYGTATERDVAQARTILNDTEASVPALQIQLEQTGHALSILLGLPPGDLREVLAGSSGIPVPPPEVAIGMPADLLRRRPDVRAAEYRAMAQGAQIGVARADLFPAFSLGGIFTLLSTDLGRSHLGDMLQWASRNYVVGPSVQWNILNYGQITNNVRLQDARFQELLITYQNTVLTAQQNVEDAIVAFLRSQERAGFLAKSTESAKQSLGLAVDQYRGGITDFTTVLTGEQSLLAEQDSFVSTLGNISSGLVAVYRALGGGWQIREGNDLIPPEVKEAMAKRTNWGDLLSPARYMPPEAEKPHRPLVRPPDW
jgi:NodT family efflux transporter outer membrane factor (OMF) lipoprotein